MKKQNEMTGRYTKMSVVTHNIILLKTRKILNKY